MNLCQKAPSHCVGKLLNSYLSLLKTNACLWNAVHFPKIWKWNFECTLRTKLLAVSYTNFPNFASFFFNLYFVFIAVYKALICLYHTCFSQGEITFIVCFICDLDKRCKTLFVAFHGGFYVRRRAAKFIACP